METKNSESQPLVIRVDSCAVRDLCFSQDGKQIASAHRKNVIYLRDAETGECKDVLYGHPDAVPCVHFSPDGEYLASASISPDGAPGGEHQNNVICVWDADNGMIVYELRGHENGVTCAHFSPDGKWLASGSSDGVAKIWDVATRKCIKTRPCPLPLGPVTCVRFSSDGKVLAVATPVSLWSLDLAKDGFPGKRLHGNDEWGYSWDLRFSSDGKQLTSNGCMGDDVVVWNVENGDIVKSIPTRSFGDHDISPDGKFVVTSDKDCIARLWDLGSDKCVNMFIGHSGTIQGMWFSPDGKSLVTCSDDRTVRLWDVSTGKCTCTMTGHTDCVLCVCFSPDGKRIASGSADSTIRVWDVAAEIKREQETKPGAKKRKADETAETQEKKPKEEITVSEE